MTTETLTLTAFLEARIAEDEANYSRDPSEYGYGHEFRMATCKAHRAIVELHDRPHECSTYDHTGEVDNCSWCLDGDECSTLRALASIYADHPDYREEWAL